MRVPGQFVWLNPGAQSPSGGLCPDRPHSRAQASLSAPPPRHGEHPPTLRAPTASGLKELNLFFTYRSVMTAVSFVPLIFWSLM